MLNGIAGAWLDYDEGNFLANGHPGMQVIGAFNHIETPQDATAERPKTSPSDLLLRPRGTILP